MHTLLQDIRGALRVLRSSRGFALVAVLSLALGIAAATTVFSLVNAVLLRPLPWADPDRLLVIRSDNPTRQVEGAGLSLLHVADIADGARGLASVAVVSEQGFNLAGSEAPRQVSGTVVSAALFPVLGVRPARGRGFLPSDDQDGSERVVVLGHTLWQRELAGDHAAIGRAVRINGEPHTVIGVMPPDFAFPERSELWVPLGGHAGER
ncbi:MAG: ABC transporter permease, partial [Gemmatimonadaceae bacterium]